MWMPAYLFIVLFFAKLYYFIQNSAGETMVRPLVTAISWAILILYGMVVFETLLRGAYEDFPKLSGYIIGAIYLLVAAAFGIYGQKLYTAVRFKS